MELTAGAIVAAGGVIFLGAVLQGSIGLGVGVFSVPILTLIDTDFTPMPTLLVAFPLTIYMTWREREHIDTTGAGWIVAGRVPGALIGAWLLGIVSVTVLSLIIASVVLAFVAIAATGVSIKLTRRSRLAAGTISGITASTASIGGPPLVLLYRHRSGGELRSSLSAIYTAGISINLIVLSLAGRIDGDDLQVAAILAVPTAIGVVSSGRLLAHVEGRNLRTAVLVSATVAGIGLIVRSLI